MFGRLGDIKFKTLFAPTSLEGTFGADYAELPLVGGKPKLQKTGVKLDEWNIGLHLDRSFCNPQVSLDALHAIRLADEAVPLLIGVTYRGWFVITQVVETLTQCDGDGRLLALDVQVMLREYTGTHDKPAPPLARLDVIPPVPAVTARPEPAFKEVLDNGQPGQQAEQALIRQHQAFAKVRKAAATIAAIQDIESAPDKVAAIVKAIPALMGGAGLLAESSSLFAKLPAAVGLAGQMAGTASHVNDALALLTGGVTTANVGGRLAGAQTALAAASGILTTARPDAANLAAKVISRRGIL